LLLQSVTGLIGLEEDLVDLVAQQLSGAQTNHDFHVVRFEVRQLLKTEDRISDLLDRLAAKGLSSDAVFQDDLTRLSALESSLEKLLGQGT